MTKSHFLLLIFCLLIVSTAFAQEKGANDYDGQKKISGTDYSYYRKGGRGKNTEELRPQANVIKFSLMSWLSGCIPFYYERRVTPWLGLQFGLGLTTRDFIADLTTVAIDGLRDDQVPNYNNYGLYTNVGRKSSVGAYVSFQPKFYPGQKALSGFFVSPMVEFKRFDYKAQYTDPTVVLDNSYDDYPQLTYTSQTLAEYRNTVDFTVNVGRQWLLQSNVSLELMGGVGFRKIWEQRRYINQEPVYNPSTGNNGDVYITSTQFSTFFRPEFNLSFIIGGCF